jgi:hypothetical protein
MQVKAVDRPIPHLENISRPDWQRLYGQRGAANSDGYGDDVIVLMISASRA